MAQNSNPSARCGVAGLDDLYGTGAQSGRRARARARLAAAADSRDEGGGCSAGPAVQVEVMARTCSADVSMAKVAGTSWGVGVARPVPPLAGWRPGTRLCMSGGVRAASNPACHDEPDHLLGVPAHREVWESRPGRSAPRSLGILPRVRVRVTYYFNVRPQLSMMSISWGRRSCGSSQKAARRPSGTAAWRASRSSRSLREHAGVIRQGSAVCLWQIP